MSRKKTEINPIRAERVKTLIEREGIKQTAFAEKIHMTQQNVSRIINRKNALTEETARQIVEKFPDYRIEWLMGYDDQMTHDDFGNFATNVHDRIADGVWGMIEICLSRQGKSLKLVKPADLHLHADDRLFQNALFPDSCYFTIVDNDGNVLKKISAQEIVDFEEKIQEYCDFMTEKYLLK